MQKSKATLPKCSYKKEYDCSTYRQYGTKPCHCHEIKEADKMQKIIYVQEQIKNDERKTLEEKSTKLKNSIEYYDEIIESYKTNRVILQMLVDRIYVYRDKTMEFKLKINIDRMAWKMCD